MNKINLIGESIVFKKILSRAKLVSASSAHALIIGETGTGKEEIAKYLHQNSDRAKGNFLSINCSALPAALMESELFGHTKGAFTTAHNKQEGLVEAARGGILFLDEIGELDISLQSKLLRFLDTGEYRKIGSTKNEYADVRIISATNKNLKVLIPQKLFREDLYYRLSVLMLDIPPLRNRGDDILLLANYFLEKTTAKENKKNIILEQSAKNILKGYFYSGNVRELQNLIYKIVVFSDSESITAEIIEGILEENIDKISNNVIEINKKDSFVPKSLIDIEGDAIEKTIKYCGGNIPQAAALLEISPSTIYRKRNLLS